MKKKLIAMLFAFLLVFAVAGQAMAYFEQGHLYRVVYDRGGVKEVVTDLGAGLNFTAATTANSVLDDNNFTLGQLGLSGWNNAYVAYFTYTTTGVSGANGLWASGLDDGLNIKSRQWNTTITALNTVQAYNLNQGQVQNVNLQADSGSYAKVMLTSGTLNTQISTSSPSFVDAALGALGTVGYVDQWLYYFDSNKLAVSTTGVTPAGLNVAQIRTFADGHTEINPNAVPIPAAAYLLGSGLLGLVGIRRKMAA